MMTREEQQLEKHFRDLARTAYQRGIVVFSDFLSAPFLHIVFVFVHIASPSPIAYLAKFTKKHPCFL